MKQLAVSQKQLCTKFNSEFDYVSLEDIVAVAKNIGESISPINGLRHNRTDNNSGWYLWSGENLSKEFDFFESLHVKHLVDRYPELIHYLGLAPG